MHSRYMRYDGLQNAVFGAPREALCFLFGLILIVAAVYFGFNEIRMGLSGEVATGKIISTKPFGKKLEIHYSFNDSTGMPRHGTDFVAPDQNARSGDDTAVIYLTSNSKISRLKDSTHSDWFLFLSVGVLMLAPMLVAFFRHFRRGTDTEFN